MVTRVFLTLGRRPRMVRVPRGVLRAGLSVLHGMGLGRGWSIAMADRMDQDLDYVADDVCERLGLRFPAFRPDVDARARLD